MTSKPGRNDPCPCGSGKKYKQCCLLRQSAVSVAEPEPDSRKHAATRAMDWLLERHGRATEAALGELLAGLIGDEIPDNGSTDLDKDTWIGIQINLTEWLLAEGSLTTRGAPQRATECLLGRGGPALSAPQREWLAQLAQRPLRVYHVTDVVPGVQITLCDALNTEAAPQQIQERSGSKALEPGTMIGCRVMQVDGHLELSGAVFVFSMLAAPAVLAQLRQAELEAGIGQDLAAVPGRFSKIIMAAGVRQYVAPPPMPVLMDMHSGEPMLLVTDHYAVSDWPALAKSLDACVDVHGNREEGWERLMDCDDGQTRSRASINPAEDDRHLSVFYKTRRQADEGRTWFDAAAGDTVKFRRREVKDPRALMQRSRAGAAGVAKPAPEPASDPQAMTQAIQELLQRSYARWADEPIEALGDKTPRQVMATEAGLERVKGLIRSYEAGEAHMAARQGRPASSYAFLWEALGIVP